jgi:hypothetical protein
MSFGTAFYNKILESRHTHGFDPLCVPKTPDTDTASVWQKYMIPELWVAVEDPYKQ